MEIKLEIEGTEEIALFSKFANDLQAVKDARAAAWQKQYDRKHGIVGGITPTQETLDANAAADLPAEVHTVVVATGDAEVPGPTPAPAPVAKPKMARAKKPKVSELAADLAPDADPYPETEAEKAAVVQPKPDAPVPTLDAVCQALQKFVNAHGLPKGMEIVKVFEVAKLKDLPESRRAEFLSALDERAAELVNA